MQAQFSCIIYTIFQPYFKSDWRLPAQLRNRYFALLYSSCFFSVVFQSSYQVVNELSIICAN